MAKKETFDWQSHMVATVSKMGASYDMELRCDVCGAIQPCPRAQVQAYTQHGFPKHCDVTMRLFVEGS